MCSFTYHLLRPLVLGLVLFTLPVSNALAGRCSDDIRRIDEALKNQYGGSGARWEWFACPVCLGSELKKDAVVTKEQVWEIRNARASAPRQGCQNADPREANPVLP